MINELIKIFRSKPKKVKPIPDTTGMTLKQTVLELVDCDFNATVYKLINDMIAVIERQEKEIAELRNKIDNSNPPT